MVSSATNNAAMSFPRETACAVIQIFLEKANFNLEMLREVMARLGSSVEDVSNDDGALNFLRLDAANLERLYFQLPAAHQEVMKEQAAARFAELIAQRKEENLQ